ncbi:hypothetical protein JCM10212_002525 [Sporobolomyces blumeae]
MASRKSEDPFTTPSTLSIPGKPSHRPTLTTLLSTTDLDAATSSRRDSNGHAEHSIELPDVPELSHELFSGETFDPSEFLLSRRHTALEDLRSELRAYLATLRTSLVGVINEEYEAFIGLSLGLKHANVAHSLSTIRRPVLSIRSEVTRVKGELDAMRDEMAGVLDERKKCREMKSVMRRLLATEEAVDKVEGLLKVGDGEGSARTRDGDESVDSPAKRLERIAAEYNHMLYLVARAGDLPFVKTLDARIARITSALQVDLSQLLTSILSANPSDSVSPVAEQTPSRSRLDELATTLQIFSSLSLVSEAEEIIRKVVVRPFLTKTINRADYGSEPTPSSTRPSSIDGSEVPESYRLAPLEPPVSYQESEAGPLLRLYNTLLDFISHECGNLLYIAETQLARPSATTSRPILEAKKRITGQGDEPERAIEGFAILTNVIVDEIASRLVSELGTVIFAAGRPSLFHQNYLLTTSFLSRIESLCPTIAQLDSLRSHPPYVALLKRFQLPVYFQLRFKESVSLVERAFEIGQASGGGGQQFVMSESEAVWNAINRNWQDDVWLEEVAGRFWKLTLQIVSRYKTWINDKVPRYVLPSSSSSANLSAMSANNGSRASFDSDRGRLTPTPGNRPGTPTIVGDEASEETILRQLTVLIADSRLLERRVTELFEERIQARLPGDDPSQPDCAAEVMREALASLTSIVPSLSSQITTILIKRCAEHLKLVRSVASQVRASTRKGPSEPSYFVHNILKELKAYLGGPGRVVEEELRTTWATTVVDEIAVRYAAILSTQKKTEDSLRWLKKGRQGLSFFGRATSSSTDDGSTDDDRVKLQMQLDVEALGDDAREVGVDIESSEAFGALRKATVGSDDEKK